MGYVRRNVRYAKMLATELRGELNAINRPRKMRGKRVAGLQRRFPYPNTTGINVTK